MNKFICKIVHGHLGFEYGFKLITAKTWVGSQYDIRTMQCNDVS